MSYLYDLVFTILFLFLKKFLMSIHDSHFVIYMQMRKLAVSLEVAFILLGMYFAPTHTRSEKAVLFFLCLLTTRILGSFILKNNKNE